MFEDLVLAFRLLQVGVLLGVDLQEPVQLLPRGADFFSQSVALVELGLQRVGAAATSCAGGWG